MQAGRLHHKAKYHKGESQQSFTNLRRAVWMCRFCWFCWRVCRNISTVILSKAKDLPIHDRFFVSLRMTGNVCRFLSIGRKLLSHRRLP